MTPAFRVAGRALAAAPALLAGCQTPPPTTAAAVGEILPGSGILEGCLDRKVQPDSLALLPKPPATGSARAAADLETHQATLALRGSPRWQLAVQDNEPRFPEAAGTSACALGLDISEQATPHLNMLLRRALVDAALATYRAKDSDNRKRPFIELGESTCVPREESRHVGLQRDCERPAAGRACSPSSGRRPWRRDDGFPA